MPELSYGSHFFQDLVEAGILYSAVFKDGTTLAFDPAPLLGCKNLLGDFTPSEGLEDIIRVVIPEEGKIRLYYDMVSERLLITTADK